MKNYSFALLFSLTVVSFSCFAQEDSVKKDNCKYGVSITVNTIERPFFEDYFIPGPAVNEDKSFSFGFVGRYLIQPNLFLRLKVGINNINFQYSDTNFNQPPLVSHLTQTLTHKVVTFSPGIMWKTNLKKLNFYGGFELPIKQYGKYISEVRGKSYSHDTLTGSSLSKEIAEGWMAFGAGVFLGFDVNVLKNFSIGGEISTSFLYSYSNGTYTYENYTLDKNDNVIASSSQTKIQKYKGMGMSKPLASIAVTILF